ncbi:MAG: hypothetical protein WDN48_19355 [Pseudolabrys sp.]
MVTAEAKTQFDRALALDPEDVMARFYLGMAADQDGRRAQAEAIWRDLLAKAPPGAPWIELVRSALDRGPASAPPVVAGPRDPSPAEIAAASKLAPDQQNQMIAGMVSRLAARLKADGSDAEGWVKLVRSYRVMGDDVKAQAAMADARRALANDPDKLRQLAEGTDTAPSTAAPPPPAASAPPPGVPGPSAADIAVASKLAPDQQNQMIVGMVARLADRLKQDGGDVEGWLRLLRAYVVLGDRNKAQAAAADARRALAVDPDKLRRIDELAKELGLQG